MTASAPRFAGIGGHHSARAATVEWLTPPEIIGALGPFELDPCSPIEQPYPTAAERFTILDDGLLLPWGGKRVWLNPPYENGEIDKWLSKMALHGRGTALIFARTETEAFFRNVWEAASALLFMRGRINFHVGEAFSIVKSRQTLLAGDRAKGNAGAPTVLCAYGVEDADILAACEIDGHFVPIRFPKSVLVQGIDQTWREALAEWMSRQDGAIELATIYRAFADHRKAAANPNYKAKIRQVLQQGPFRRVGRGQWSAA